MHRASQYLPDFLVFSLGGRKFCNYAMRRINLHFSPSTEQRRASILDMQTWLPIPRVTPVPQSHTRSESYGFQKHSLLLWRRYLSASQPASQPVSESGSLSVQVDEFMATPRIANRKCCCCWVFVAAIGVAASITAASLLHLLRFASLAK